MIWLLLGVYVPPTCEQATISSFAELLKVQPFFHKYSLLDLYKTDANMQLNCIKHVLLSGTERENQKVSAESYQGTYFASIPPVHSSGP